MNIHTSLAHCLVVSALVLPLSGCSMFRGESKGTTAVKTSHGTLPIRREASTVVDLAQPTVVIEDENVIVTGNVRLRGAVNPDARVQITIVDRYGQVADRINAKLVETDEDRIMTYRVKFGPIPGRGSSLLVAYDNYRPTANYSADYIGSGGAGAPVSGGGRAVTGNGVNNRRTANGSVVSRGTGSRLR
jgi:hypothetical protein